MATQWYQRHLGRNTKVMLITNDKDNKRKATDEGLSAETGILLTHLCESMFFCGLTCLRLPI